jgi:hypothetical protein
MIAESAVEYVTRLLAWAGTAPCRRSHDEGSAVGGHGIADWTDNVRESASRADTDKCKDDRAHDTDDYTGGSCGREQDEVVVVLNAASRHR